MDQISPHILPDRWMTQIFACRAAAEEGIVRRARDLSGMDAGIEAHSIDAGFVRPTG